MKEEGSEIARFDAYQMLTRCLVEINHICEKGC